MKTNTIIYLFIAVFLIFSCKKTDAINPASPSDALVGTYTMTQFVTQGQTINLPYTQSGNQLSGKIIVAKISATQINVTLTLNKVINGVADEQSSDGVLEVKANGSTIEMFDPSDLITKIGTFTNGIMTIDSDDLKVTAKKI